MKAIITSFMDFVNGRKILNKLMIIYFFGGLIPLLLVSFILSVNMRANLVEQATYAAATNNELISARLLEVIGTARDVSDGLYTVSSAIPR